MLGVVVAFVLLGSVVFAAPSSNATISFMLVLGILFLGRYLNQVALQQPEPLKTLVYGIYFLIPHLEWYDVRDLITYDHNGVGWVDYGLATLYALLYMVVFLLGTWLVFRRKPLNL
jgi:ABC-type transport system involved in multi-copper enzyme maturation permease subunit